MFSHYLIIKKFHLFKSKNIKFILDSPALPPSAAAHELFRGFSFVAPSLYEEGNDFAQRGYMQKPLPLVPLCPVSASALAQRRTTRVGGGGSLTISASRNMSWNYE